MIKRAWNYMTPVEWVLHVWAVGMIVAALWRAVQ